MRLESTTLLIAGLVLLGGAAQAEEPGKPGATAAAEAARAVGAAETLKERLSDKASDEQRVDNCHVPVARRGSKVRPDRCDGTPRGEGRVGVR